MQSILLRLAICLLTLVLLVAGKSNSKVKPCTELLMGQYRCEEPVISPQTQLPETCEPDNSIRVFCYVAPDLECNGLENGTNRFEMRIPNGCAYSSGLQQSTALLLSVFLGWLGIDRFYLGYYAVGFLKMFSLGCFTILYLADIVLIALQILGPADGTAYSMNYYGPKASPLLRRHCISDIRRLHRGIFSPWTNVRTNLFCEIRLGGSVPIYISHIAGRREQGATFGYISIVLDWCIMKHTPHSATKLMITRSMR